MKSVLHVEDLSIGYQKKKQLLTVTECINFNIEEGKLVGLIGGNGVGKSTLLKTITKQIPALSGVIHINGKPINTIQPSDLAKEISMVLTEKISHTNLSVRELVALGRHPYTNWIGSLSNEDILKTNQAIAMVGITELEDKKCHELSDGQLQKVMIARALAQDTPIIILDEPTTHLDIYQKVVILKLLRKLTIEANKTILFSTHEINAAIKLCDQLIVMKKNTTAFGNRDALIENKVFEDMFPKDSLEFDKKTTSFIFK